MALLDWIIMLSITVIILLIGISYRKQSSKSLVSFFLGGRNLPWYLAGLSMVATTFAADTPLAVTELVSQHGISGNWLWWNFLAGGMLTVFVFAPLWRRSGVVTEAALIELRYSGWSAKVLRVLKAIYLGLFMNVLIMAWVHIALIALIQVLFDIPHDQAFLITAVIAVLVAVYAMLSGLLGVVVTDTIQFVLAMTGSIILTVLVVRSEQIGGVVGLKEQLNAFNPDFLRFFPKVNTSESVATATLALSAGAFIAHMGLQWWASWYPGAEPGGGGYIVQRILSTKNEKHAVGATFLFQLAHYCIRPWPWILVGLCAVVLYPDLPAADAKLGYVYIMRDFLPVGLKGLMLAAFLAAYMSTISTQLNWGSSYLVEDICKRFLFPQASSKRLVSFARLATLLLVLISIGVATQIQSISQVWLFIIECGAGLGFVLIARWFWWRINAWTELAATLTPFIVSLYIKMNTAMVFPESYFYTIGITIAVSLLVTLFTRPVRLEQLKAFYNQVSPSGWWQPVTGECFSYGGLLGLRLLCWLLAIICGYALLFMIGHVVLLEFAAAGTLLLVVIVSSIGLVRLVPKIFD